ncbi:MAG: FxLYD domain-containing protein [Thermodesulfobacteriota bacterium]
MKKPVSLIILTSLLMMIIWGCASPNQDGAVTLDGPILESINQDGDLQFNGSVVNNGDGPVHSVFVLITLMDDRGNVVGANSVQVGDVEQDDVLFPGERKFFSVTVNADPSEVVTKNVEIFSDPADEF